MLFGAFVCTRPGQRFDDAAKLFAVTNHLAWARMQKLASAIVMLSVIFVVGAQSVWAHRRSAAALLWTVCAVGPPWLMAELGKVVLPRPHLHVTPPWIGASSWPSGHVTITTSCLLAMVTLAPPWHRKPTVILAMVTLFASMTLVMTSGMHRPSDVFAAPLLASLWAVLMPSGEPVTRRTHSTLPLRWSGAAAVLAIIGVAIAAPATAVAKLDENGIPPQSSIDRALYGAIFLAGAIVFVVGVIGFEILGPISVPWADHSPMHSDNA